ncbi:hypothetical protein A5722_07230 [Mycobacterium vulneris]|nr:hypothetical protein A5722_07230 [Mycolicibacterium vulneris]OCB62397.1 hypothetical protein A5729_26720 [Mycolicibacterium vulneris]
MLNSFIELCGPLSYFWSMARMELVSVEVELHLYLSAFLQSCIEVSAKFSEQLGLRLNCAVPHRRHQVVDAYEETEDAEDYADLFFSQIS